RLPQGVAGESGLRAAARRLQSRMPWSKPRHLHTPRFDTIPVAGEGNIHTSHQPPPSRPEDEDLEIRPDQRAGVPYPEWDLWTQRFLKDHVAVLERKAAPRLRAARPMPAELRRWFEEHTHRVMRNRLEDGCDLDVDRYIEHHVDRVTGKASE